MAVPQGFYAGSPRPLAADGIALGIREPRERASWNGDGWHQHFPTERSRFVEISLNVIDLNVKNRVTVRLVA